MSTKCAAGLELCTNYEWPGGKRYCYPHQTDKSHHKDADGSPCPHDPALEGKEKREGARRLISSRVSGDTVYPFGQLSKMQERTGDDRRKWDGKAERREGDRRARLRDKAKQLKDEGMRCNCDLDNWEPESSTGHSWVCRIHKKVIMDKYQGKRRGSDRRAPKPQEPRALFTWWKRLPEPQAPLYLKCTCDWATAVNGPVRIHGGTCNVHE